MVRKSPLAALNRRYLIWLGLLVISFYVLLPQIGDFRDSWQLLSHPNFTWTALAVIFTSITYLSAAATYCFLAFKPLNYFRTVVVEIAAMFINRLLPSGIGALGTNFLYLKKSSHTTTEATTIVAVNNLLGFLGHILLFIALVGFNGSHVLARSSSTSDSLDKILRYGVIIALVIGVVGLVIGWKRLRAGLRGISRELFSYRRRPLSLGAALLSSMTLTLANILCLYACCQALGASLPLAVVMLIFSAGLGAGTATPTPGGLGGFEAGLVAGLVAYHVASAEALAIALLYRLISYWLALLVGSIAFIFCQRRQWLSTSSS